MAMSQIRVKIIVRIQETIVVRCKILSSSSSHRPLNSLHYTKFGSETQYFEHILNISTPASISFLNISHYGHQIS